MSKNPTANWRENKFSGICQAYTTFLFCFFFLFHIYFYYLKTHLTETSDTREINIDKLKRVLWYTQT